MARYSIDEIKRLTVCPILFQNKWDYNDPSQYLDKTFLYGVKEMIRWYYRRGKQISSEALVASLSQFAMIKRVPVTNKMELESAFRQYASRGLYQQMDAPFYQKEIEVQIRKDLIATHEPFCMAKKEKTVYFISSEYGKEPKEKFLNRYEVLLQAVWSFYMLDQVPVFVNLYYENGEIKEDRFKVRLAFITQAKEKLFQIGKSISRISTPPVSICDNCNRREECPTQKTANLLKK